MISINLRIRRALREDHQQIASLMFHEAHMHRHLDWRSPIDWLGSPSFWVAEEFGRILAAFACPQDPLGVAWIRLFVHLPVLSAGQAWQALWDGSQLDLPSAGQVQMAAIVSKHWFQTLLLSSGFEVRQNIVLLDLNSDHFRPAPVPRGAKIRPLYEEDIPRVSQLDREAFGPFWHNSVDALTLAFAQAVYASIAEDGSGMIGYQLSTGNPFGAHLARLAVHPQAQGRGFGAALVSDLVRRMEAGRTARISVNTQEDNLASLALYKKLGFRPTGERFPVLTRPAG
jgi:ribosomal protein S18 acetylase RimI-like enzyme